MSGFRFSFFYEFSLSKQNSPRWDNVPGVTSRAILFAYVPQKGCQAYIIYGLKRHP